VSCVTKLFPVSGARHDEVRSPLSAARAAKGEAWASEAAFDLAELRPRPPHPELRRTREQSRLSLSPRDLGLNFGERQGAAAPDKPLGRDLLLRVDFGDLHGTVALSEPMADAAAKKDAGGK
jgi:hypothetical protein